MKLNRGVLNLNEEALFLLHHTSEFCHRGRSLNMSKKVSLSKCKEVNYVHGRDELWNENSVERMNERKENSERSEAETERMEMGKVGT